ncbi:hypothetical protein B566_EDAN015221 [Ephemera danica]|nr:hypothetical protein B566_EDAN015221 [Ephemera danica]
MCEALGAELNLDNFRGHFPHSSCSDTKVEIMLDPCHMIKLVRNTFEAEKFRKQIMKVNLAVQTLSASVADAIEFCDKVMNYKEFKESGPTSYNHKNKRFEPLHKSRRKTGMVGFFVCLSSTRNIYDKLCTGDSPRLKYLLTYKMSQDHLEMFFGAIRSRGGWNNSPTCDENVVAYIGGKTVKMVEKTSKCLTCINALEHKLDLETIKSIGPDSNEKIARLSLIIQKSRGGLKIPSDGVVDICIATEKCIRVLLRSNDDNSIFHLRDLNLLINIKDHMFDTENGSNHLLTLIKSVCNSYVDIRMYDFGVRGKDTIRGDEISIQRARLSAAQCACALHGRCVWLRDAAHAGSVAQAVPWFPETPHLDALLSPSQSNLLRTLAMPETLEDGVSNFAISEKKILTKTFP